jgi:hypothetical protein
MARSRALPVFVDGIGDCLVLRLRGNVVARLLRLERPASGNLS